MKRILLALVFTLSFLAPAFSAELKLDESAADDLEWGYHPAAGATLEATPPNFTWRPQRGVSVWEIECGKGEGFDEIIYRTQVSDFNVHTPAWAFSPGTYTWRYRGRDSEGGPTNWSQARTFTIVDDANEMPMPPREELLARIPKSHPRLFLRPEQIDGMRELAKGEMKGRYGELVRDCERILADPPPTQEPPTYPEDIVRGSDDWREIWWGNRRYTIRALNSAATLGFTYLLDGNEEYGQLAKRILLDCAQWDPKGSTGYRYNDEAGMPYNYYFSRTYTFISALLTEEEREQCRRVMKIRGEEMYNHLYPRHLWQPYSSHSNRAWHFLGEVGIAFLGEVEGAEDWVWFAMNVFYNVYPVWSDEDGGWHEGASYWSSYLSRFTWWADVMRAAVGIDAYDKPFFEHAGYYAMYLMPPGKVGGGFGDLTARREAEDNASIMTTFATQSGNRYWQWYVEAVGGPRPADGYVGFVRGALPKVEPKDPTDLPASRMFRGTGQAYLNTTILDAEDDVQVVFKSSPFGTWSHGYEANNSFLLWAYGKRLLIRTGYRDSYGSAHHRRWMWSTRSVNNITVNGRGQAPHSAEADGRIVAFETTPELDVVVGEAGDSYFVRDDKGERQLLDRFTRSILFVKPDLVIVYDRLVAPEPSTYQYWLHAVREFGADDQHNVQVRNDDVACTIDLLAPSGLTFQRTNEYDPNPRPRITLREWHLTAETPEPRKAMEFVTLCRPHRVGDAAPRQAELTKGEAGYVLKAKLADGEVVALLPSVDGRRLAAEGLETTGEIVVRRIDQSGKPIRTLRVPMSD